MKLTYGWFGLVAAIGGMTSATAATYVPENRLWPNGVVPYVYADDFIPENVVPVEAAMAVWESAINVQFVPRTDQADYVLIRNAGEGNGSSSPTIGRGGGEQALNIRDAIWTWSPTAYTYGLAHELGHVLGLYHTHQRPDRDDYVTVYNDRIDPDFFGNFPIESGSLGYPRNEMDYDSIMAYPECTFSLCEDCGADLDNCRVIEINDPAAFAEFQDSMGQRDHLSELDALAMSFMYPQSNWKFLELNYAGSTQTGTFHNPYRTFATAVQNAPNNSVLFVQPATYARPVTAITKPMILRAPLGGVRIQ